METNHFNQYDLAKRWKISERTLERWRWLGVGPTYLKIGGRVVYRLSDIEAFENQNLKKTSGEASFSDLMGKAGAA